MYSYSEKATKFCEISTIDLWRFCKIWQGMSTTPIVHLDIKIILTICQKAQIVRKKGNHVYLGHVTNRDFEMHFFEFMNSDMSRLVTCLGL